MRKSNQLIGLVNFFTFLLSIPILAGGIWLSGQANSTDCMKFLQWPVIVIGAVIMATSLAGLAGSCYRNVFLMQLYLWAMFLIVVALLGFVIFAYSVTEKGSGRPVSNAVYKDYYLQDFSGWLENRVSDPGYWAKIRACIEDTKTCAKLRREYGGVPESASMFALRKLSPIESGCCKPPTECGYVYFNETMWNSVGISSPLNPDCARWSNDQGELCYACDSCKAGVLGSLKKSWRKVSLINVVVLVSLFLFCIAAGAAYRNVRRSDNDEARGQPQMVKTGPSMIHIGS